MTIDRTKHKFLASLWVLDTQLVPRASAYVRQLVAYALMIEMYSVSEMPSRILRKYAQMAALEPGVFHDVY